MRVRTMAGLAAALLVAYLVGAVTGRPASQRLRWATGSLAARAGRSDAADPIVDEKDEPDNDEHHEVADTTTVLARVNSNASAA